MAAKSPPPTRAAIDIDGPTEARSTSSERRPALSRCATCWSTEFARARPSRLLMSTRCSMSKRATATWLRLGGGHERVLQRLLEALAVGQAGERVGVVAPGPLAPLVSSALRGASVSSRARPSSPLGVREAHEALGAQATRRANRRAAPGGRWPPRPGPAPRPARREQRASTGTVARGPRDAGPGTDAAAAARRRSHVGEDDVRAARGQRFERARGVFGCRHLEAGAGEPAAGFPAGRGVEADEQRRGGPTAPVRGRRRRNRRRSKPAVREVPP